MAINKLKSIFRINRFHLDNGLDVVIVPIHKAPVVCVDMAYKVGSKDEWFDRTGMAHLFEHIMFEGTENVPKGEFDKICSVSGGTNNAYTSFDMTNYYMTLPSCQVDIGLWLEADRLKNFLITKEALTNQQNVVIEEIKQTVEDQPYGLWRELISANAYTADSSYSWEVHGSKEHVAKVTLEEAQKFKNIFYTPKNASLIIVGDVNTKTVMKKVEKYFSDISNGVKDITRNKFNKRQLVKSAYNSFEDDVPTSALFVGYHCEGYRQNYSSSADIIANILGSGRSSMLYKSLINEKQIASETGAYVDKREDSSLLILYAFASNPKTTADELFCAIQECIDDIGNGKIDDKEIEKANNQLYSQFAFEIDSFTGIADLIAIHTLFHNEPEKIFSTIETYGNFTKKDISTAVKQIFKKDTGIRIDAVPKR